MIKKPEKLAPDDVVLSQIRMRMNNCDDVVYADVALGVNNAVKCTAVFIDGMISSQTVYDYVLKPLAESDAFKDARTERDVLELIAQGKIYHGQRKNCDKLEKALGELLFGAVLVVFDGEKTAVAFDSKGFEKRAISEPTNENVLKGSKDAFVETMRVNTAIVRQRIQTPSLKIHQTTLGKRTNTSIAIVYLDGVANHEVVDEMKRRIFTADIDGPVTGGRLESILYDMNRSLMPRMLYTERPDKFIGNILEGRVGIIIDGIPIAYVAPIDLHSLMQASEDYTLHFVLSSIFRIIRYVCTFAALVLPAMYVSVTTFHQEMIPTKLALAIISSKQGVPFPTYMEVLMMLLAFEVLLEAGLRLPRTVGQAVSIVGALVVGQAAISASILSPGVVIIIAAAGITGFVVPNQDLSSVVRIFRSALVLLSMAGGLFGVTVGLILILYNMCAIDSFGTPYLSPFVGADWRRMWSDTVLRASWRDQTERPANIRPEDVVRQGYAGGDDN